MAMSERLDVTYNMIWKYETARARITAGRLAEIAAVTGRPIE